ncbi:hypothetical protein B0T09DRAFT_359869 [Sordaria sp. MPI-SDFR-AT-0083]|nr:hypothetical protein B0T09DRAFT_359869 [Sordaria sp. MPI-SDFR-AT-0083]
MFAGSSTEPSRWYDLSISISTASTWALEGQNKQRTQLLLGNIVRNVKGKGKATAALMRGSLEGIIQPNLRSVGCLNTPTSSSVLGLCQLIRRHEAYPATENGRQFYGNIMDLQVPERRFGLYAPTSPNGQPQPQAPLVLRWQPSDLPSDLTLRQLLVQKTCEPSGPWSNTPLLFPGFQDKLQLAFIIAINILHLYSSPWLPKIITLDDILFRPEDEASCSDFPSGFLYRPFLQKLIPCSASSAMPETVGFMPGSRKRETTVFPFGLILIQLMLERVINELDMKPTSNGQNAHTPAAGQSSDGTTDNIIASMTMDDYMEKHRLGKGIRGFINIEGLQSEKFCQEFYVDVISMLQEALDKSMEL